MVLGPTGHHNHLMEWRHRAYSPSDVAPWRWLLKEEQTHGGHAFTHETVEVEDPGKRTLQSAPLEHQHRRIHEGSAVKSTYFGGYFRNSTPDSIACEICYWIKNRLVAHFSVVSWRPNSKIISKPEKMGIFLTLSALASTSLATPDGSWTHSRY